MTDFEDLVNGLVEQYVDSLDGQTESPNLDSVDSDAAAVAAERIAIINELRMPEPELPDEDPVAAFFGFDRAGEMFTVNGVRVKNRRKDRVLQGTEFVQLVMNAGATFSVRDLMALEQDPAYEVDQTLASALAAALATPVGNLLARPDRPAGRIAAILEVPTVKQELFSWADDHGWRRNDVITRVRDQLQTAVFRAVEVDDDAAVTLVRQVLETLEP